jgi:hypothetical protein
MIVTLLLGVVAGLVSFELWGSVDLAAHFAIRVLTTPLGEPWRGIRRKELEPLIAPCRGDRRLVALARVCAIALVLVLSDLRGGRSRTRTLTWGSLVDSLDLTMSVLDRTWPEAKETKFRVQATFEICRAFLGRILGGGAIVIALAIVVGPERWLIALPYLGGALGVLYLVAVTRRPRLAIQIPVAVVIVPSVFAIAFVVSAWVLAVRIPIYQLQLRRESRPARRTSSGEESARIRSSDGP